MRIELRVLLLIAVTGCAGPSPEGDPSMAPYNATVVFRWLRDAPAARGAAGTDAAAGKADAAAEESDNGGAASWTDDPVNQRWIEDQIILGLAEHRVFSDFGVSKWEDRYEDARLTRSDIIVAIRIGSLAEWDGKDVGVDPGLAVLTGVLWFGTAIGGLWVEDQVFSTKSEIEVYWKRVDGSGEDVAGTPETAGEIERLREEFPRADRVYASGEYNLSLWDRAKIWSSPGAYFTNIVMPATFVPFYDEREVQRSLVIDAIDDVRRDLAQALRAGLGAAGAPLLFRLDEPSNGSSFRGSSVQLRFNYGLGAGSPDHTTTGLKALSVDVRRDDTKTWEPRRVFNDEEIGNINQCIRTGRPYDDFEINGLGPGLNLLRFTAETELEGHRITNTIALWGEP